MITRKVNSKASVQKKSSNDYPFSPVQPVLSEYLATSTASQTVINLSFSMDQSLLSQFFLFVDGKKLTLGSSNDYTFTSIDANNFSSQVTLTQSLAANLNIQAYKLGLKKESEFGQDNRIVTINANLALLNNLGPTVQRFTSGSGQYFLTYGFIISSANATVGATYTNNGITYTVSNTIASATILYATGSGAPTASGVLTKTSGTGDSIISFSTFSAPKWLKLTMVGGGGAGGGSGSSGGNGGNGTSSTWTIHGGALVASATAGAGGSGSGATFAGNAGGGVGAGGNVLAIGGAPGGGAGLYGNALNNAGGSGGNTPLGGGGIGYPAGMNNGVANTGGGGSGFGGNGSAIYQGQGGGGGGYLVHIISSPATSYDYVVGTGGVGAAGTGGTAGGAGGSGLVVVEEYYK